jgi:hypothetical protein
VNQRLALLAPVLARPANVAPLVEAFAATTLGHALYFIADEHDELEHEAVRAAGGNLLVHDGGFASKVNWAVAQTVEPLILIVGDDVRPVAGWFDAALRVMQMHRNVQVVGINDLIERPNRPEHAVHFLVTREYAQRGTFDGQPGPCSEAYRHWFVDDELIATAQWRGAYRYSPDAVIKHLHPMAGTAVDDDTYRKGRQHWKADGRLFHERMRHLRRLPKPPAAIPGFLTVIVGTFGSLDWVSLARERAIPSALALGVEVIHKHADTLAQARNMALAEVATEFVSVLDADDELDGSFEQAMAAGTADVRAPSVRCMRDGRMISGGQFMPKIGDPAHRGRRHQCSGECLRYGNWIVVGAAARTELVRKVGGWDDAFPIYEDYATWARMYAAGATVEPIPAAIYMQHLRADSRNHTGEAFERRHYWHERIGHSVWPDLYEDPDAAAA